MLQGFERNTGIHCHSARPPSATLSKLQHVEDPPDVAAYHFRHTLLCSTARGWRQAPGASQLPTSLPARVPVPHQRPASGRLRLYPSRTTQRRLLWSDIEGRVNEPREEEVGNERGRALGALV